MAKEKERLSQLKQISISLFGGISKKYASNFSNLKKSLIESDTRYLFRTYVSIMLLLTSLVFVLSFIAILIFSILFSIGIISTIFGLIIVPSFFASLSFSIIYLFPSYKANKRKKDIEMNLPFAINHMSAIVSSGVPPYSMFKILANFKEYGELAREASKIVRNVDSFGLDVTTAIREVISKTPSVELKDILEGILTNIQTGGSLKNYLNQKAEMSLFEYRLSREKYNQMLSTYADFYTALLIATPLLLIAILSVLSLMGGQLFGLPIDLLMNVMVFVLIPILNVAFLVFLHLTQPKM